MATSIPSPNDTEMNHMNNNHQELLNDTPISAPFCRPEIEDAAKFNAVLSNAAHFAAETSIEVFASPPLPPERLHELGVIPSPDNQLDSIRSPDHVPSLFKRGEDNGLRTQVYFLDFDKARQPPARFAPTCAMARTAMDEQQDPPRLKITRTAFCRLVEDFEIPMTFVDGIFQDVIWDGSGRFVRKSSDGKTVERIDIFFRAEWGNRKYPQVAVMADFVRGMVTYLIIEAPHAVKKRVREGGVADRPLAIAASVLDECLNKWKRKINKRRKELLSYETRSATEACSSAQHRNENISQSLHHLSTKTHQMVEHLADFEERCRFLSRAYPTYINAIMKNNRGLNKRWPLDNSNSVVDSLMHLISGADTCRRWASNYNARTHQYEMTLYHLAEQADGLVNVRNSETNTSIAQTNTGLSVIAMVFLPGTFVAGLFSMAFFTSPSSKDLGLKWLWLYFAVTVPVTIIVFATWKWWNYRAKSLIAREGDL